jgi:hypothetical protein
MIPHKTKHRPLMSPGGVSIYPHAHSAIQDDKARRREELVVKTKAPLLCFRKPAEQGLASVFLKRAALIVTFGSRHTIFRG